MYGFPSHSKELVPHPGYGIETRENVLLPIRAGLADHASCAGAIRTTEVCYPSPFQDHLRASAAKRYTHQTRFARRFSRCGNNRVDHPSAVRTHSCQPRLFRAGPDQLGNILVERLSVDCKRTRAIRNENDGPAVCTPCIRTVVTLIRC